MARKHCPPSVALPRGEGLVVAPGLVPFPGAAGLGEPPQAGAVLRVCSHHLAASVSLFPI